MAFGFFLLFATTPFLPDGIGEPLAAASVLGFLRGLHLMAEGMGYLYRTASRPGELTPFITPDREVLPCLGKALAFWEPAATLMSAAVHWYLVSPSLEHQYEWFTWQYTVLDNLHRLTLSRSAAYRARPKLNGHATRPVALSAEYGSPLPLSFADPTKPHPNAGRLADRRNDLIHEARWDGGTVGYSVSHEGHELTLDLQHFNAQLILGALGIECGFRAIHPTRETHFLGLKP